MIAHDIDLLATLSAPASSPVCRFQAKDSAGRGLDCLKVFQAPSGRIYGLYHIRREGRFDLVLGATDDLVHWKPLRALDQHAHQGTAQVFSDGSIVVAFEKDGQHGNWIRVRRYSTERQLLAGKTSAEIDLPRRLSQFAEGTPSIESPPSANPRVQVNLRFHYYREGVIDRQAKGTLSRFRQWSSAPDTDLNSRADDQKILGNFGDRDSFSWNGQRYHLFEGQLARNDWSSWRIYVLRPTDEFLQLPMATPGGSKSFANPSTSRVNLRGVKYLVVTMFLPSQGNAANESGELIYAVPIDTHA